MIQDRFKIGENLITSDNELISNKFKDFFINIGITLAKSIPRVNKNHLSYLGNRLTESKDLAPVSENEIGQLIKLLESEAAWFDYLNSMCLKISSRVLVKPLIHICNLSLCQGIVQEQLTVANSIPLYTSDSYMLFNNYRTFLYHAFCQRYLKRLITIGLQLSLKYFIFHVVINIDVKRSRQLKWQYSLHR